MPDIKHRCVICLNPFNTSKWTSADGREIDCPTCGHFVLEGTAFKEIPRLLSGYPEKRSVLSYFIFKRQTGEQTPLIRIQQVKKIIDEGEVPSMSEQADNLLVYLGNKITDPGMWEFLHPSYTTAAVGARSGSGVEYILYGLAGEGLVETKRSEEVVSTRGRLVAKLTFAGWRRYQEIQLGAHSGYRAFMAMDFKKPELDNMFKNHFQPAVDATGFKLESLRDRPQAGLIDNRLRVEIKASRFVIADLSHDNYGAYWEAGYAEGLGKPVIYTCEASKFEKAKTHFDTNHHQTVVWSFEKPEKAVEELMATIRYSIPEAKQQD